jgi:NitT/TauT family transport system substrate-binding protein
LFSTTKVLPLEKLVLATPRIPFSSLLFLAKHNDLFAKHGLDVQLVVTETGKEALEMTLAGEADIAAVATLPLAFAVASGATPRILAVISKSDYQHSVVARRDRGIAQAADLKDKTIGILAGTSAQFYLEALLINANVARNDVHIKNITPQGSQNAIVGGDVDAVALFSPWDKRAAQALGESGVVFAPTLHTTHWTLTSDKRFPDARPMAAKKLLRTLMDAQALAVKRRGASLDIVARELKIPRSDLDDYWKMYSFDVQLPQSLIATLEREILWVRSGENVPADEQSASPVMPDFLDYLSFSALQSVKPSAIRITH